MSFISQRRCVSQMRYFLRMLIWSILTLNSLRLMKIRLSRWIWISVKCSKSFLKILKMQTFRWKNWTIDQWAVLSNHIHSTTLICRLEIRMITLATTQSKLSKSFLSIISITFSTSRDLTSHSIWHAQTVCRLLILSVAICSRETSMLLSSSRAIYIWVQSMSLIRAVWIAHIWWVSNSFKMSFCF